MNTRVKYMIPTFAAVIALVFAFAPYVMADGGAPAIWGNGAKHMKHDGPIGDHAIVVDGFIGTITIPETIDNTTHDSLKSQISVTLGQAVSAAESKGVTNAQRASIGIVQNQDGNKYLVWIITSTERDATTGIITTTIIVVDAGDATHSDSTTKTFDPATMKDKMQNGAFDHSKMWGKNGDNAAKFEQFKQKLSQPTGNPTVDAARAHFLDLKQQLHDAIQKGDTVTAQDIKKQLDDLRPSLYFGMKSPGA